MTIKSTLNKVLNIRKMKKHDVLIATLSTASMVLIPGGTAMLMKQEAFGAILVFLGIAIIYVRQNLK